ncbi:MAG: hypothetical protein QXP70_01485 [Methanomassiliicoccales archaeon]
MIITIVVFLVLFVIFALLGFLASRWRKGDLRELGQWALAGRRLGPYLAWFLVGGDLYTAYTFIAIPSAAFGKGSIYNYATPYVMTTFAIAMVTMVTLWKMSRRKNYITGVDFVKDRFNSRTLAIAMALTGIVAELPYIALQIVGMKAVLQVMLAPYFTSITGVSEIALIISFIVLAAFTFVSGLRGATLTAVMKDVIILVSVAVVIIYVPLTIKGGFSTAFHAASVAKAKISYAVLPSTEINAYISLFIMSALTLYFYPHAINGVLSSRDLKTIRFSTAMLPLYGLGLFLLTLFGVLIFAVPSALSSIHGNGSLVVPALISATMPSWFTGFAFLGIFIGGLVPAAIMAISQANLLTRNIIKEFAPRLKPSTETSIVKWASVVFKFLALGFVFLVSPTYSVSLQLLGGVFIAQTLPSMMLGLYDKHFLNKWALFVGWIAGMGSGIWFMEVANHFSILSSALMKTPFGLLYVAASSLAINLFVSYVGSAIARLVAPQPTPAPAT